MRQRDSEVAFLSDALTASQRQRAEALKGRHEAEELAQRAVGDLRGHVASERAAVRGDYSERVTRMDEQLRLAQEVGGAAPLLERVPSSLRHPSSLPTSLSRAQSAAATADTADAARRELEGEVERERAARRMAESRAVSPYLAPWGRAVSDSAACAVWRVLCVEASLARA